MRVPAETLVQDLSYGLRTLGRSPGFTAAAVLTLALGIGGTTAVFSVVYALLFKPLPYPEPDRLMVVTIAEVRDGMPDRRSQASHFWTYPHLTALEEESESFSEIAAYGTGPLTVRGANQPERAVTEIVTASYFRLLGVEAALGRVWLPDEETPTTPVAVLGHDLWHRQFAGDPAVLGQTIDVENQPFTVLGVMGPEYRGQSGTAELWLPVGAGVLASGEWILDPGTSWWKVIARLGPGVTETQARTEMAVVGTRLAQLVPTRRAAQYLADLLPLRDTKLDPAVGRAFLTLLAAVGFVLLIVCANTASLMLVRAETRRREFAVRLALGARRGRLARQLLTESLLLSMVGGAAALLVAVWSLDWLAASKPWNTVGFWSQYARTFDYFVIRLDWPLMVFMSGLVLLTGTAVGVMPAWQATRAEVSETLKTGGGGPTGALSTRGGHARATFVVVQISLSLVLLVVAGLMIRSFAQASASVSLGFEPAHVLSMTIGSDGNRPLRFYEALLARATVLPGVERVALASAAPLSGGLSGVRIRRQGDGPAWADGVSARLSTVTPDFFSALGVAVIGGRVFTDRDRIGTPRVAVVSRAMAAAAWPGQQAVGQRFRTPYRIRYGDPNEWHEVVGVVDDVRYGALEDPLEPVVYLSAGQPLGSPDAVSMGPDALLLRSTQDPASLVGAVREALRALDPTAPVYDVATLDDRAATATARYRFSGQLMTVLAALAVVLAAVGVYGVVAYTVSSRTTEIGIRLALGARSRDVMRVVLGGGITLTVVGVVAGLGLAIAATRMLGTLLFEVSPTDVGTLVAATLVIAGVAALACYIPARRAVRVDPAVTLRNE